MGNKVAIVGTVGLPAKYGGFETLVENIIDNGHCSKIKFSVYCSSFKYPVRPMYYKGTRLFYLPISANGVFSTLYDIVSLIHASFISDKILILGVSGCCILPIINLIKRKKIIVNVDGLEHKRQKWGRIARRFLKYSEYLAVKNSDLVIADNEAIAKYIKNTYNKNPVVIAYGGDHVVRIDDHRNQSVLDDHSLVANQYSCTVCRIEPENNIHVILEAFKESKNILVIVGNWAHSKYGRELYTRYSTCSNIKMLNPIYDVGVLYELRRNAQFYIHGHSAGGTNPSLVEAMFFRIPVICYDVDYNRETTENNAFYFNNGDDLMRGLNASENERYRCGTALYEIALKRYQWDMIAKSYARILE